jgi:lipopolysaccharide biosynthesis glycosyltransferase
MNNKNYIVTVATENYKEYLYTFVYSIAKNLEKGKYALTVVHDGLSEVTISNLNKLSAGIDIHLINIEEIAQKYILGDFINQPTYWRFLIDVILPENIDRCLYVDLDTLVLTDLDILFNYDLEGNTIGACLDYLTTIADGVSNWESLSLDPEKPYFNAGVLLVDLAKFRGNNIAQKSINIVTHNTEHLFAKGKWPQNDQYGLNVALIDDWLMLPRIYNYGSGLDYIRPTILHFIGGGKPGSNRCNSEFTKIYYEYKQEVDKIITK